MRAIFLVAVLTMVQPASAESPVLVVKGPLQARTADPARGIGTCSYDAWALVKQQGDGTLHFASDKRFLTREAAVAARGHGCPCGHRGECVCPDGHCECKAHCTCHDCPGDLKSCCHHTKTRQRAHHVLRHRLRRR